jgi:hypothetical protein
MTVASSLLLLTGGGNLPNWNWFSGGTVHGETVYTFFDSMSIKHLADRHIQVWTKTIAKKDIDEQKPTPAITGQAADRLRHHYVPKVAP